MSKQVRPLPTPDLNQDLTAALLGQAVRARRTQNRLRLEDTALLCGVAKQTLQDIELGRGTSQMNTVLHVCTTLGIKLFIASWQSERI